MQRVLLCSDEPILAEGLRAVFSAAPGFELCAFTADVADLRDDLAIHRPDLLLLDLKTNVDFTLISSLHQDDLDTKIILWAHTIQTELALQAMSVGVRGVLRRTLPAETLVRCLTRVADGELWFEKSLTDSIMSARRFRLTRREGELVSLLSHGLKNKEIATSLGISEGSVKVYLSRLFQKLGVKDRFELALYGLKNLAPSGNMMDALGSRKPAAMQAPRSFFVDRIPPQPQIFKPGLRAVAR
ncbi:MAG TPA: response regulator transcription factor [Bryobacteraceae bacterium]|nr:response regulator transcription factor [Bryobacteraceae bacterium]